MPLSLLLPICSIQDALQSLSENWLHEVWSSPRSRPWICHMGDSWRLGRPPQECGILRLRTPSNHWLSKGLGNRWLSLVYDDTARVRQDQWGAASREHRAQSLQESGRRVECEGYHSCCEDAGKGCQNTARLCWIRPLAIFLPSATEVEILIRDSYYDHAVRRKGSEGSVQH